MPTIKDLFDFADRGNKVQQAINKILESRGATAEETEFALQIPHKSTSGRYTELRDLELIRYARDANGLRVRRATVSGKYAYVHVATDLGRQVAALDLPIRYVKDITRRKHHDNPMSNYAHRTSSFSSLRLRVLKHVVRCS